MMTSIELCKQRELEQIQLDLQIEQENNKSRLEFAGSIAWDEQERIQVLHLQHILEAPPQDLFSQMTRLATQLFECQNGGICFVDTHKGVMPMEPLSVFPRNYSYCTHIVAVKQSALIHNVSEHKELRNHPSASKYVFYAGAPIMIHNQAIGTIYVYDFVERRDATQEKMNILESFADILAHEIKMHALEHENKLEKKFRQVLNAFFKFAMNSTCTIEQLNDYLLMTVAQNLETTHVFMAMQQDTMTLDKQEQYKIEITEAVCKLCQSLEVPLVIDHIASSQLKFLPESWKMYSSAMLAGYSNFTLGVFCLTYHPWLPAEFHFVQELSSLYANAVP